MNASVDFQYKQLDIMHIVNRSQGGLGIEQNGVTGCRYHHQLLDNGSKGLRPDMISYIEEYMKRLYERGRASGPVVPDPCGGPNHEHSRYLHFPCDLRAHD